METQIKEKKKFARGLVTFTSFIIDSQEAEELQTFLGLDKIKIPQNIFNQKLNRLKEICKTREFTFENQIVLTGREVFTRRLIGDNTYTGEINYGAIGTGATAVADSDIKLVTEVKRKGIATKTRTADSVSLRFFYTKSDASGTFTEFGTFIDGTASADSGQLFNRVLTGGWVKSATEALTVTVQFDLNAA